MSSKSALRQQLEASAHNTAGVTSSEWTIDYGNDSYRIFYSGGGWRIFHHPGKSVVGIPIGFTDTKPQAFAFIEEHINGR